MCKILKKNLRENYNNGWKKIKTKMFDCEKLNFFAMLFCWMINCEEIAFAVHPRGYILFIYDNVPLTSKKENRKTKNKKVRK